MLTPSSSAAPQVLSHIYLGRTKPNSNPWALLGINTLSSFNLDAPRTVRFYRRVRIHIRRRNKRNLTRSTKKNIRRDVKPNLGNI
ncbi:hypothetical protein BTUL_0173g00230 [Botrytis tulipae]|uniref:Uncharacterized protein n=1 Tax=Botrytis tulipae TaxID=87230 RepID=A0A4Z1EAL1_9HELO|nr:hypothetical protein BTUL_0173g00230 [Botrytis tulipae]